MEFKGFTVEQLTQERFDDFATVLGASGIGGCWCMYWAHPTTRAWGDAAAGGAAAPNKELFAALVDTGPPPGLLVYEAGTPVAWCRVMARSRLPGLDRSRAFATQLDVEDVWSLSCFVVRSSHRGRGLMDVLVEGAIGYATEQGAAILEGYPSDGDNRKASSSLWTGVTSVFLRHGFEEVQRLRPDKPMMRLRLRG